MRTNNNNFSCLPFYTDIELQNHKRSYAYGNVYPLYTEANFILPFQIIRDKRPDNIQSVILYDVKGNQIADISQKMRESGLQIVRLVDYDIIVYTGNIAIPQNMRDGQYYITITDGVETWYSEVFTVVQDISPYLMIEWYNRDNLVFDAGMIYYEEQFRNRLYFCAELGMPEYPFTEEGETRDGYFFPTKQISEKTYKCTILAPEYLCDVMRFIRMADYVRVRDKYGRYYECDTFLITPKWQEQGNLASVEIEFETATVVKAVGRGYIVRDSGDFNNDFNNDFLNE